RLDREFVRQPLRAAEPQAESAAGRETIGHRGRDIANTRPVVGEGELHATARSLAHDLDAQGAAAAVIDRVAGDLARRRDELGLVDDAEPGLDRPRPYRLAHPHDIVRR